MFVALGSDLSDLLVALLVACDTAGDSYVNYLLHY